jgi:K+-transporting ATPase KdpF subunit
MNWSYLINGVIGVALIGYLFYSLLRPERF